MIRAFAETAWEDYVYWQETDKNVVKKINKLLKEIERIPFSGIGKPEPLKYEFSGFWSRRITGEHRLIILSPGIQLILQHVDTITKNETPSQYLRGCPFSNPHLSQVHFH